ncbi:hypothetical protein ACKWTF_016329 [Chironomus riparius]
MLLLLLSVIAFNVINASNPVIDMNCKTMRKTICYNNNLEILEQSMQIQKNDKTKYETLFINEANVEFLPINIATTFPDIKVLKVIGSSLKSIEKSNFEGLEKVVEVNLEKNLISNLPANVFEPLKNIKKINLNSNKISSFPSNIFASNTKLMSITAVGNVISSISDQAFKNLANLKLLFISNNQIEDLRSGTFDDCVELKILSIYSNRLRHVPENIFNKNTNLEISQKHFVNNTCIDEFVKKESISAIEDLKRAFKEHCKPLCYDEMEELKENVKDLNEKWGEANETIDYFKDNLNNVKQELGTANSKLEKCESSKVKLNLEMDKFKYETTKLKSEISNLNLEVQEKENSITNLTKSEEDLKSTIENCDQKIIQLNSTIETQLNEIESCKKDKEVYSNLFIVEATKSSNFTTDINDCKSQAENLTNELKIAKDFIEKNDKILIETKKELNIRNLALIGMENLNKGPCNENEFSCRSELNELKIQNQNLTQLLNRLQESKITQNPEAPFTINCKVEKVSEYLTCGVVDVKAASRDTKVYDILENSSLNNVNGLDFIDSKFIDFPAELAKRFENFRFFKSSDSVFLNFNENICEYSNKIEEFLVTSSEIGWSIRLDNCKSLKSLQIENSGIREVSAKNSIFSLIKINLNGNKIKKISKEFFSKFENLKSIQLANNKIESIDGNVFDGNNALETINLSENPIRKINGQIFTNNRQLATVFMKNSGCINDDAIGRSKIEKIRNNILTKCG